MDMFQQNFSSPMSNEVVFTNSEPPKKKKKVVLISVFLAVVLVLILVAVFLVRGLGNNETKNYTEATRLEAYNELWKFYYDDKYYNLLDLYDSVVGFTPDLKITKYNLFFPIREDTLDGLLEYVDISSVSYEGLSRLKINNSEEDEAIFRETVSDMGSVLNTIKRNIDIISEFYGAFIEPIYEIEAVPAKCVKTDAISTLMDGKFADIAGKYYTVYCDAVDYLNEYGLDINYDVLKEKINGVANDAAESLNNILEKVDINYDKIEDAMDILSRE